MLPIKFDESNMTYKGRKDTPEHPLEIIDLPTFSNGREVISCWEISEEELLTLASTRKLWLRVYVPVCPPMKPQVEYPFVMG